MAGPVPCPSCGEPVPPGRLACPSCGALVASVARPAPEAPPTDPDAEADAPEPGVEAAEPEPAAEPKPQPEPAAEPEPEPDREPVTAAPAESEPAAAQPDGAAAAAAPAPPAPQSMPATPAPEPGAVATPRPPEPATTVHAVEPAPGAAAPPTPIDEAVAADGIASGGIVPGSYLPPSTVHRVGAAPAGGGYAPMPSAPPPSAQSPSWAAPLAAPAPPVVGSLAGPVVGAAGAAAARPGDPAPTPGRASILADLPFDAPDQLEGWLVALGGGMGILGFFLPWTAAIDTGLQGYLSSWGLGIVSHLPVFLFLVVVTALALLPNRVATWVRTGVCGMVGGGILFGVVWLYLGSDASQLGALLCAVAAILLIAGGIIAVAPGRSTDRSGDA